jgi:hypothetical protein
MRDQAKAGRRFVCHTRPGAMVVGLVARLRTVSGSQQFGTDGDSAEIARRLSRTTHITSASDSAGNCCPGVPLRRAARPPPALRLVAFGLAPSPLARKAGI